VQAKVGRNQRIRAGGFKKKQGKNSQYRNWNEVERDLEGCWWHSRKEECTSNMGRAVEVMSVRKRETATTIQFL